MSFVVLSALVGCVLRYGTPPENPEVPDPTVAPEVSASKPDFASMERELLAIVEANDDLDANTAARIAAAQDLTVALRNPRTDPHAAAAEYLERLIAIERRTLDMPQLPPEAFVGVQPVVTETPIGVSTPGVGTPGVATPGVGTPGVGTPGVATPGVGMPTLADPAVALEEARGALAAGRYADAIAALRPYRGGESWAQLAPTWQEAVDGYVHAERERAGQRFIDARAMPEAERLAVTREVLVTLEGLLRDYPETSYRSAIERNIELVRKELPAEPKSP